MPDLSSAPGQASSVAPAPAPLHVGMSVVSQDAAETTGTRTIVRELVKEFARRPAEVSVDVLCNEHGIAALEDCATPHVRLLRADGLRAGDSRLARLADVMYARLLGSRLSPQLPPAVAVTHYPLGFIVPLPAGPSVVTIHDVQHYDMPQNFSRSQRLWRQYFLALAAKKASLLIADSEHARVRVIDATGLAAERVQAVYGAVDHARFRSDPDPCEEEILSRLCLPERYVFYPASLWPHKNHPALLEALARLRDDSLHLVLTGSLFGGRHELMATAARLGLDGRVCHLGLVSDEALPVLYRNAQALVFPSSYEGFGLPPLEAMACGCPVASSLAASLAEVCGTATEVLAPEDPEQMATTIGRVLTDQDLRERLRQDGFAQAAKFSWSAVADAHLAVYRRAVEG